MSFAVVCLGSVLIILLIAFAALLSAILKHRKKERDMTIIYRRR